jgi:cell wall-associated NlpC family hydrolase
LRRPTIGIRALIPAALVGAVLLTVAPTTASPVAAAGPTTEAQQIIAIARKQIGDPWRHGASGPKAFDCSGLVIYSFKKAGDSKVIGKGKYRSARALYRYFKARGLADRKNPKPGDLVIWGRGTHVGIYIGKGKAISTLTSGVRIHKVHAVRARFTAYLHTGMWKQPASPSAVAPAAQTPVPLTPAAQTIEVAKLLTAAELR